MIVAGIEMELWQVLPNSVVYSYEINGVQFLYEIHNLNPK